MAHAAVGMGRSSGQAGMEVLPVLPVQAAELAEPELVRCWDDAARCILYHR